MLTADSMKLKRGLDRSQRHVTGFTRKAKGALGTIGKGFALGIGAAAGMIAVNVFRRAIGSIRREFVDQLSKIDAIAKFSDRLGIATDKLVGLQLQTGLAGSSIEQLNVSLRTMVRNVGDASQGFGQAIRAFEMLGISAQKLQRLDAGDQFKVIAEQISKLPTQAQKASAAFAIFGRNGVKLLGALQQGAAGVDKARQRAADLGATITREEAARIEQLNDALLELKTGLGGVVRRLAVELGPTATAIIRQFTEMVAETNAFRQSIGDAVEKGVQGFAKLLNFASFLNRSIKAAQAAANMLALALTEATLAVIRLDPTGFTDDAKQELEVFADEIRHKNEEIRNDLNKPLMGDRFLKWVEEVKAEARKIGDEWKTAGRETERFRLLASNTGAAGPGQQGQAARDLLEPIRKIREMAAQLARKGDQAGLDALRQRILAWKDPLGRAELAMLALADAVKMVNSEINKATLASLREEAKGLWEATRTPMEQFRREYERLKMLLDLGLISRDTANRALRQARERLIGGERARAETGSLSRTALTGGVVKNDPNRDAQRERKKQSETLRKIEQNTRDTAARAG